MASEQAKQLLTSRIGYRSESFRGSGVRKASEVIHFEVSELGNDHILEEIAVAFDLGHTPALDEAIKTIRREFGEGATALWLGTREDVKEQYCEDEEEEPDCYVLPKDAVLISDLGSDGQLFLTRTNFFLKPDTAEEKMIEIPLLKEVHIKILNPQAIVESLREEIKSEKRECFGIVCLDTKNCVVHSEIISIGTLNAGLVHPREVFKTAILHSSASIIMVHNHPSGDPTPSNNDIELAKKIAEAGELLGISLLDSIVVGGSGFISLNDRGVVGKPLADSVDSTTVKN